MSVDPAFKGVGTKPGLEAWRIEKLKPVRVPQDQISKLHVGDSYIFLKTIAQGNSLVWNIHFWLGKETTADESGVAAYKTVELDESLGGGPVQYRECQGYESDLFMSYFKKTGLEYLEGGVASGFKTVKRDEYETKLFQVKGKRTVRVTQVPCSNKSLSIDDVYVLDAGLELYLFNGPKANRFEKAKGIEFINKVRNNELGARANVTFIDEDPKNDAFWKALGGYINVTRVGEDDEAHEKHARKNTRVVRVSDSSSVLKATDVTPPDGVLTKDLLKSEDVFIVDSGATLYVWVGKGASGDERKNAFPCAMKYLNTRGLPAHTPISRMVEGAENQVFKALFRAWDPPKILSFEQSSKGIASKSSKNLDVAGLMSASKSREESLGIDPCQKGKHDLTVWRIENMEKVEIPREMYGQFYGGDSYIVLHSMTPPSGKAVHVIYFWQGRKSSTDEKSASALHAKQLDDDMGGSPVQVRVIQGKEPAHFRSLFKGRMVVHQGGKASSFANVSDQDSYDTDGVSLFHVKGTSSDNAIASQVDEVAGNLNSGDCFVLETPHKVFVWYGSGSSGDEQNVAGKVSEILQKKRPLEVISEGSETDEFWTFLGGKAPYPKEKSGFECPHDPRLFHCSNAYGYFDTQEIFDFSQDDLNMDDVFLLDTYTTLYIWIGSGANEEEKRESSKFADEYLNLAKGDGREDGTTVVTVHCNNEPPMFTSNFLAWDPNLFDQKDFKDPYEARLQKLKAEKEKNKPKDAVGTITIDHISPQGPKPVTAAPPVPVMAIAGGKGQTFSYDQLVAGVEGIDITCKESYLSDAEFSTVFGTSRAEFDKLPKWRQQAKKKEVKLF